MSSTAWTRHRRISLSLPVAFACATLLVAAAAGPGVAFAASGGQPGPPHPINPPACPANPHCASEPEPPPPPPPPPPDPPNPPNPPKPPPVQPGGDASGGSSGVRGQQRSGGRHGGETAHREAANKGSGSSEVVLRPKHVATEKNAKPASDQQASGPLAATAPATEVSNPERSSLADRLLSPTELDLDAEHLAEGGLLTLLLIALMYLPVTIFNKATEKNHEAVTAWMARPRAAMAWLAALIPFSGHPLGTLVAGILASTALFSFIEPGFPTEDGALQYLIGMLLGFAIVSAIFFSTWKLVLDRLEPDSTGRWRVYPPYILLAAVLVVMARLAHFLPGVVLGTVAEYEPAKRLSVRTAGIRVAITYGVLMVLGLAAWFAWIPVSHAAAEVGASSLTLILDSMLTIIFVTSLESVAFGLIPMTFLDGNDLFRWRKWLWGAMWGGAMFWFALVVLNPALSTYGHHTQAQAIWLGLMFSGLMILALGTWGAFRVREARLARLKAQT